MKTPVKAHSETWWWWQHHVVGMLGIWSEMYGAKYRAIREGNQLVTVCKILETKAEVQLPTVQQPQVYSKATLEWFKTMNLNVLERQCQCPEIGHASELLSTEYLA